MSYMGGIYNLISISVLVIMTYLLYSLDFPLIIGMTVCTILQFGIKEITYGWYPPIFKRPDGATNCNLFNTGGCVDHMSGFPSGHVATMTVFMETLLLRSNQNSITYYILYKLPILIVAYARVMKGCHNIIQVIAGYILGYVVANVIYRYEDAISKYARRRFEQYLPFIHEK